MKRIAVSMRVDKDVHSGENRDALDERWFELLAQIGLLPVLVPNHVDCARRILHAGGIDGVLLTGGNNLAKYGNGHPLRDEVETLLIDWVQENALPLLGVCRGMQMIQDYYGAALCSVFGHIGVEAEVIINGKAVRLNSYHEFGTKETVEPLVIWARAVDGVVKGVRHRSADIYGIMWHPERLSPFHNGDMSFIADVFAQRGAGTHLKGYWE